MANRRRRSFVSANNQLLGIADAEIPPLAGRRRLSVDVRWALGASGYPLIVDQIAEAITAEDAGFTASREDIFQVATDLPTVISDRQQPPRFALGSEPLWLQFATRQFEPDTRTPLWRPRNAQLKPDVGWSDFNSGCFERLCEIDVDGIAFFVLNSQGERVFRLDVDHVVAMKPFWIASIPLKAESIALATFLRRARWHVWTAPNKVDWNSPFNLIEPEKLVQAESPLATWRSDTPQAAMIAVTNLFAHMLGPRGITRLLCQIDRCSPEAEARRKRELLSLGGRRRLSYDSHGRTRNPTLAHCAICGRALSDASSAALGVGPECRRQSPVWFQLMKLTDAYIPPQFWIGGQSVVSWRSAVSFRRVISL